MARSSAAIFDRNGGRQIGAKLSVSDVVATQPNKVLTKTTRPVDSTAMSWISRSPVVWARRGTYSRSYPLCWTPGRSAFSNRHNW